MMEKTVCPKTWLTESILATFFCCLPFGVVGIIHAANVTTLYAQGLIDEAYEASADAEKWTKIAFWCAIVGYVSYFMLIFSGVLYS
jgi:hypothetical protein